MILDVSSEQFLNDTGLCCFWKVGTCRISTMDRPVLEKHIKDIKMYYGNTPRRTLKLQLRIISGKSLHRLVRFLDWWNQCSNCVNSSFKSALTFNGESINKCRQIFSRFKLKRLIVISRRYNHESHIELQQCKFPGLLSSHSHIIRPSRSWCF